MSCHKILLHPSNSHTPADTAHSWVLTLFGILVLDRLSPPKIISLY